MTKILFACTVFASFFSDTNLMKIGDTVLYLQPVLKNNNPVNIGLVPTKEALVECLTPKVSNFFEHAAPADRARMMQDITFMEYLELSISTVIRPVIRTLIRPLQTFKILLKIA